MFSFKEYEESSIYLKEKMGTLNPKIAIILGSGLGVLSNDIQNKIVIKYSQIPNFPVSTVEGHAGELIIGKLGEKDVIAMNR